MPVWKRRLLKTVQIYINNLKHEHSYKLNLRCLKIKFLCSLKESIVFVVVQDRKTDIPAPDKGDLFFRAEAHAVVDVFLEI